MPERKCPYCDAKLDYVFYEKFSQKVWNEETREWEEDDDFGDDEYCCPRCGVTIEYPYLEEMGVV